MRRTATCRASAGLHSPPSAPNKIAHHCHNGVAGPSLGLRQHISTCTASLALPGLQACAMLAAQAQGFGVKGHSVREH